jgi:hypothetical protein
MLKTCNHHFHKWTPEQIEIVKTERERRLSYYQIGKIIRKKTGADIRYQTIRYFAVNHLKNVIFPPRKESAPVTLSGKKAKNQRAMIIRTPSPEFHHCQYPLWDTPEYKGDDWCGEQVYQRRYCKKHYDICHGKKDTGNQPVVAKKKSAFLYLP